MLNCEARDWLEPTAGGVTEGRVRVPVWPPRSERSRPVFSVRADQSSLLDVHGRFTSRLQFFSPRPEQARAFGAVSRPSASASGVSQFSFRQHSGIVGFRSNVDWMTIRHSAAVLASLPSDPVII